MAVFDVDVIKNYGELREFFKDRHIHLANLDRRIEAFICFLNELAKYFLFKQENRQDERDQEYTEC